MKKLHCEARSAPLAEPVGLCKRGSVFTTITRRAFDRVVPARACAKCSYQLRKLKRGATAPTWYR